MINKFDGEHAWLSNFFPSAVVYNTIIWPSIEHAYQANKTLDIDTRMRILLACDHASQARKIGRSVTVRPNWTALRVPLMRELLRTKFATGKILAEELMHTYPHQLIEGNKWNDTFWGVCNGVGHNWLGKLLMERRQELMLLAGTMSIELDILSSDTDAGNAGVMTVS